jgi:TonB-dependent starch-binding outer membrane protein SusC
MKNSILYLLWISILTVGYCNIADAQTTSQQDATDLTYLQKKEIIWNSNPVIQINLQQVSMEEALVAIAKQARAGLFYDADLLPDDTVSLESKDKPLSYVINELLKETNLEAYASGRNILLREKKPIEFITEIRTDDEIGIQETVRGQVVDAQTGEALPGVNILIQGTSTGTATNIDGEFELQVPSLESVLVVSYIGYQTQEVYLDGQAEMNIMLQSEAISGDELIVVGYGALSTRQISSSVQNISIEDLGTAPVAQIGQLLQGRMSGVQVSQVSGRPGEGLNIQIRGAASLTAGADPLYVVDGSPLIGGISHINPSEIESISILKDAAAKSIYGSRGANGVVIVQTKSAAMDGRTSVDFNAYVGFEQDHKERRVQFMNAREYAQFQREIAIENNRPIHPDFENPDQAIGPDWQDLLLRTSPIESYNLSINTGTDRFSTSATLGYFNQGGILIGTGYDRISLRVNSRFQPSERVNIGFNLAPNISTNNNYPTDGWNWNGGAYTFAPPWGAAYNEDGSYRQPITSTATWDHANPLALAEDRKWETKSRQLNSSSFISYELLDGLEIESSVHLQIQDSNNYQFFPESTLALPGIQQSSGSRSNSSFLSWTNENTVNYLLSLNNHQIDFLAGFTAQQFRSESIGINGSQFVDDKIQEMIAAGQFNIATNIQEWSLLSYLGRINYNYSERYLISASFRRDGSSRFGPENRWGNFVSVSGGWIVTEENFWDIDFISFLKLRGSYGTTGNFNIGNYTHHQTIAPSYYIFDNSQISGRASSNLGDRNLTWETNNEYNLGADIYFLNDRLRVTYNYYNRDTDQLLFDVDIPRASGFSNLQTNIGEVNFWGHEFDLQSTNIQTSNFSWSTNLNISFDRNKVMSLATPDARLNTGWSYYGYSTNQSRIGHPIGVFRGAIQDGVYVDEDDFNNSPKHSSSAVGTVKFRDLNGDGEITFPEDMTIIGNPWPDFTFGFTNQFYIHNFDISLNITGTYGNDLLAMYEFMLGNLDGVVNPLKDLENRWRSPSDPGNGRWGNTLAGTTFLERDRVHTGMLHDGSHINFKNFTIGYTIPSSSLFSRFRLYLSAQNLYILSRSTNGTKFPNPEVNTFDNESNNTPGVILNTYPLARTFSLGVNISF